MNLDLSIHRMAFREGETLGMAQLLVARKRQELQIKIAERLVAKAAEPAGATLDNALKDMEERSQEAQREAPPHGDEFGVLVNKTA